MEFTPTQQAFIDDLISKKYTEAYAKAAGKTESAEVFTLKASLAEAHNKLRIASIEMAAIEGEAVNPEQVVILAGASVKVAEDGHLTVIDERGERRYDRTGAPLTVQAYVSEFLDNNRHLRRTTKPVESGRGLLKSWLTF